jgi:hypothetical protein
MRPLFGERRESHAFRKRAESAAGDFLQCNYISFLFANCEM